ncbi:MAG: aldose epimerase family protein [Salaquimonas sp.]
MIEPFGTRPSGDQVQRVRLSRGDLSANIITYGASLQDLRMVGHEQSLVLGFETLEPYLRNRYFGAMVGRVANRIANGEFELNGKIHHLNKNQNGRHTLHGGQAGIDQNNWKIISHFADSVTLQTMDAEALAGFPGDCEITCTYTIKNDNTLYIEISAKATTDTVCNIAHHSYFNLTGAGNVFEHELQMSADHYLPVDEELIPTGEIKPVQETEFDFTSSRPISASQFVDFDHNFCLANGQRSFRQIAQLKSAKSGVAMTLFSTEPGLQMYTGKGLNVADIGHNGTHYRPYSGLALEPQFWPDAPNRSSFPSIDLKTGNIYQQQSAFVFSLNR